MKPSDGKHAPDKSLYEGDWNREIVARLVPELRAIGFDARVLVVEDQDIGISDRAERANRIQAAEPGIYWIYLSIHINASPRKNCDKNGWDDKASGFSPIAAAKVPRQAVPLQRPLSSWHGQRTSGWPGIAPYRRKGTGRLTLL